MLIDSSL
jgi:altered-inheritance-of-mitochondria protein 5